MTRIGSILFLTFIFCLNLAFGEDAFDVEQYYLKYTQNKSAMRAIGNEGQFDARSTHRIRSNTGTIFTVNDGLVFNLFDPKQVDHDGHDHGEHHDHEQTYNLHGLKLELVNCRKEHSIKGLGEYETNYNYFLGNDKSKWISGAKASRAVLYEEVYEGIDFIVYSDLGNLKYDFVIHPNSNPDLIATTYVGADDIRLNHSQLEIETSVNSIVETRPVAYQLDEQGRKVKVACNFKLRRGEITYVFPEGYDKTKVLIIDPELVFATMSGSRGDSWGFTATFDEEGNAYSGGTAELGNGSNYLGYPTTMGAFQEQKKGAGRDVVITKYNPTGTNLIYSTFLGGSNPDSPMSMIVNGQNQLVVVGNTGSADFPMTTNAYDAVLNVNDTIADSSTAYSFDIFVAILSADGSSLVGSTFIGGSNNDGFNTAAYFYGDEYRSEVEVGQFDKIFICSSTNSSDFPTTPGVYDSTYGGIQDAVVMKLSADASSLEWSTYFGGDTWTNAISMVLDEDENVYFCGGTGGPLFRPTDFFTLNTNFGSGFSNHVNGGDNFGFGDGYAASLSEDGTTLRVATYLQATSSSYEHAYLIEMDTSGDLYVMGITEGNYYSSPNVYSQTSANQFVQKMPRSMSLSLLSGTFGSGMERFLSPTAMLIDNCNRIYVSGWGTNRSFSSTSFVNDINGFPTTLDAIRTTEQTDGEDFYTIVFSENMERINYASYFGGDTLREHVDGGTSRYSKKGIVYQAVCGGCGGSQNFPATEGAFSEDNGSINCNSSIFKLELKQDVVKARISEDFVAEFECLPDSGIEFVNLSSNGNFYQWDFGDGDTINTTSQSSVVHDFDSSGTYFITLIVSTNGECFAKSIDTTIVELNIIVPERVNAGNDTTLEQCEILRLNACCGVQYSWTPAQFLSDSTIPNPQLFVDEDETFYVTMWDEFGCVTTDSINVKVDIIEPRLPNIFTPNGDQYNDYLTFEGFCRQLSFTLYNRWGKLIYHSEDYKNDYNGSDLPDGSYYYIVRKEDEEFKGWVQVIR